MKVSKSKFLSCCTLALVVGCGDDTSGPAPADFEPLCEQEGPVKLIDFDPQRQVRRVVADDVGERHVFLVRFEAEDGTELWSVDPCGQDPILLAEDVEWMPPRHSLWPELAFACSETDEVILALDPLGVQAPNPILQASNCSAWLSAYGLLGVYEGDEGGVVTWVPGSEDPLLESTTPIIVYEGIKTHASPSPHAAQPIFEVFHANPSEVFFITNDDELTVVDLESLTPTVLATDVREFDVGGAGRWIAWQGSEVTNGDPDWPQGPIVLLDRETGESRQLDDSALAYVHTTMFASSVGLFYYRVGLDQGSGRWIDLDTLEPAELPSTMAPIRPIDESRLLLGSEDGTPPYAVLDVASGEMVEIYAKEPVGWKFDDDGLVILHSSDGLVRYDYEGGSRLLAHTAHHAYLLAADDHVITPYAVNGADVGSLVIVEPETLAEQYIDHDVATLSLGLHEADGDLRVSYAVVSSDPARNGLWLGAPK